MAHLGTPKRSIREESAGTTSAPANVMKLRSTLVRVAVLASGAAAAVAAGACSSSSEGTTPSVTAVPSCGGCNCGQPPVTQGNATPEKACAIASDRPVGTGCNTFCKALNGGAGTNYFCMLPSQYTTAFANAQDGGADAGDAGDAGAGGTCPDWTESVVVQCGYLCLGRRTAGIADPIPAPVAALGPIFAERAYLEAVSVHAFARLERELAFHGAPPALRQKARRARRDEIRHTAMTTRLARRFGTTASLPQAPCEVPVRDVFAIARENAVEGCVRETYGAVIGLLEAATSSDADVRRSARLIAEDECRHAELAMEVARWIAPKLSASERAAVDAAVAEAIAELGARGDRHVVALLDAHVWREGGEAALIRA